MRLDQVLENAGVRGGLTPVVGATRIRGLAYDSRRVQPGYLFAAFPGAKTDGRQYAGQALARGAAAVISELEAPEGFEGPWIQVEQGRKALAMACRNFHGPAEAQLSLIGITGTNGKTTFTYVMDGLLRAMGRRTGILGTIGNVLAGEFEATANTTPESVDLYELFERLKARQATDVVMEVSSHALALGRVYGLAFHTAVFSNLSQDHLDFHPNMEHYFRSKCKLFGANGAAAPRYAVVNADDAYGRQIQPEPPTELITYGLSEGATVRATDIALGFEGVTYTLTWRGASARVHSPLVGEINVYNTLAACAAGLANGFSLDMIAAGIATCEAVPGRFERVDEGQPFLVVVDYAHTPDALRNAIGVARSLKPKRVITVFGCGGDRDRSKRPLMGAAAAELSDYVVLTSDNPRSEDPLHILTDAMVGLQRFDTPYAVEVDRTKAVHKAVRQARTGDLVLIAGKGHETYQILRDETIAFDDREVARTVLREAGFGKGR
jgi:UDP-N-acetylmuramoyl-L-alanyl-D-glutamate--2,6-diaminopimelate ligase